MKIIDIEEVLADFEGLIERAADGEAFVISRNGKPLVVVRPASEEPRIAADLPADGA